MSEMLSSREPWTVTSTFSALKQRFEYEED
jgi:hypothetical protein